MSFLDFPDEDPKRVARRPLLGFVLVTLIIGAGASIFTAPSIPTWYAGLAHPALAPPNWVFAPVWTTLYVLMAVAAWRVWRVTGLKSSSPAREALAGEVAVATRGAATTGAEQSCEGRRGINKEMIAYGVQLALNFAWSAIFFAAHQIELAMIEIIVLVLAILLTTILFFRRDRLAGFLFLPYLAWTGFAAILTHAFWVLNP
jgi:benzodiazapine receptor